MRALLDIESMVEKDAPIESISTRLESLNSSLNEQLLAVDLKIKNSAEAFTDLGIVGLKFKIESQRSPQVETIFPDTPAMMAHILGNVLV